METQLESNIRRIYLFKFLKCFMITSPIAYLFFKKNGLSSSEIMNLQSIYLISVVLFEIPSGYFSDFIGRKKALILSAFSSFLAYFIYSFSHSFFYFAIVHVFLAISSSLSSGSDSALLYESFQAIKKETNYKKNESNLLSIESFSEATASILGGLLATINMRYNVYCETFVLFLALVVSFYIIEPKKQFKKRKTIKESFFLVKENIIKAPSLKWFILYSSVISSSTYIFAILIPQYLKFINLETVLFGLVFASIRYSVTIFSMFTDRIEVKLGEKYTLISFPILFFVAFLLMSIFKSYWAILVFFIIYFLRAFNKPILKSYVNSFIENDVRATILSLQSSIFRIIAAIISSVLGYITVKYSLSTTFLFAGIFHLLLALIPIFFLLNKNKN